MSYVYPSTKPSAEVKSRAAIADVCCGSGTSAIPAAKAFDANGSVLGVDLADDLLGFARAKAEQSSYSRVEFRSGDLLNLDCPNPASTR